MRMQSRELRNGREPQQVQGGLKESGQDMAGDLMEGLQGQEEGNTKTKHSPGFSFLYFLINFYHCHGLYPLLQ